MLKKLFAGLAVFTLAALVGVSLGRAVEGEVLSYTKFAEGVGGIGSVLDSGDYFGLSVAVIGDLNGDTVTDLAVGAPGDDDVSGGNGAVYILFLEEDGSLHTGEVGGAPAEGYQKISDSAGEFDLPFGGGMAFGTSVAALGDLNEDGVEDIAVGAPLGAADDGIAYILFLDTNGTVSNDGVCGCGYVTISDSEIGLGLFEPFDAFGASLGAADIDDNGVMDLLIGADGDDDGGTDRGAVYVAFLTTTGAVDSATKITSSDITDLGDEDFFGSSVASIGDLNGDDVPELVIGAPGDDDGDSGRGAVYVVYMTALGGVHATAGSSGDGWSKISDTQGDFTATLDNFDQFGFSVANMGDMNEDGIDDIAVGANQDSDGGSARGAVYILFLTDEGIVDGSSGVSEDGYSKISSLTDNFTEPLGDDDFFGVSVAGVGDLDGDGNMDLIAGANADDDGGAQQGAVYILFLDGVEANATPSTPNPPSAFTFGIADTGTCTWDPNIYLSVKGSNLAQVIVSDNLRFVGAQVLPYTPNNGSTVLPDHLSPVDNTMYIAFKLPSYATGVDPATGQQIAIPLYGPYSVYAVGRSGSGNITSIQTDSITFTSSEDCTYPYEVILEEDTGDGSEEGNEGGEGEEEPVDPLIPVERHQIISLSANMNDLTNEFYLVDTAADGTLVKRPDPRVTNYDISFSWLNKGYSFLSVNQRTLDSLPTAHAMLPEGPAILKFTEGSQNYFYIPSDNSAPREITTPNLANELFLGTPWQSSVWILGPEVPSSSVLHGRTIPRYDVAIVRDWRNNR